MFTHTVGNIDADLFHGFRLLVAMECGADVATGLIHDRETGVVVYRSEERNAASHAQGVRRLLVGAAWMQEQMSLPCGGEVR